MRTLQRFFSLFLLWIMVLNTVALAIGAIEGETSSDQRESKERSSNKARHSANSRSGTPGAPSLALGTEASLTDDAPDPSKSSRGLGPSLFADPPASWADSSFRYRKNITTNPANVPADLTNFPVLIDLYDSDLQQKARADGWDIMFTDVSGTQLAHELELFDRAYNATHAHLVAWVKADLSGSQDTILSMYFGKPLSSNQETPENVWDSDFKAIWHLNDDPTGTAPQIEDATANENDGTAFGSMLSSDLVSGAMGGALNFDGSNDYVDFGNPTELQITGALTVGAWFRADYVGNEYLVTKMGPGGQRGWDMSFDTENSTHGWVMFRYSLDGTAMSGVGYELVEVGQWYHVVGVFNPSTYERFYINGQLAEEDVTGIPASQFDPSMPVRIARRSDGSSGSFDGTVDEVRISTIARSAEWIATEYNNQNDPNTFYSITSLEDWMVETNWAFPMLDYRKNITIDSSRVSGSGSHTNFPVLIELYDTDLHNPMKVQPDGDDIAFGSASGSKLNHEIESFDQNWNDTHAHLVAWVQIPSLATNADKTIGLYYGNSLLENQENPESVWNTDYAGVWHLNDIPTDTVYDSTANNNDGTPSSGMASGNQVTGQIDGSIAFDEADSDQIDVGDVNSDAWTAITVEAWVYHTEDDDDRVICKSPDGTTSKHIFALHLVGGQTLRVRLSTDGSQGSSAISLDNGTVGLNAWHHIAFTWDNATETIYFYVDGAQTGYYTWGGNSIADSSISTVIGNLRAGQDRYYSGMIDEARISKNARSADWLATQYNNTADPQGFYSIDEEEALDNWTLPFLQYRKAITLNASQVSGSGTLTNFPVLLDLNDTDLHDTTKVQADGDDICFVDASGAMLDHEIERFDQTGNGTHARLVAWIRIPHLSGTTDTNITMYYGNSGIPSLANPAGVWSADYGGVWHLGEATTDEGSGAVHADSTGHGYDGTQDGNDDVPGLIGNAQEFDGTNDVINVSASQAFNPSGDITLSGWFKLDSAFSGSSDSLLLMEKYLENINWNMHIMLTGLDYEEIGVPDGSLVFKLENGNDHYRWSQLTRSWIADNWYYFAILLDVSQLSNTQIFINGSDDTGSSSGTLTSGNLGYSSAWGIGGDQTDRTPTDLAWFDGLLDEI
ncbi:MAG: DUF2341 domain-containing protein, partial [Candidatus Hodarchaeales archaeon]